MLAHSCKIDYQVYHPNPDFTPAAIWPVADHCVAHECQLVSLHCVIMHQENCVAQVDTHMHCHLCCSLAQLCRMFNSFLHDLTTTVWRLHGHSGDDDTLTLICLAQIADQSPDL